MLRRIHPPLSAFLSFRASVGAGDYPERNQEPLMSGPAIPFLPWLNSASLAAAIQQASAAKMASAGNTTTTKPKP